jgi:heme/copper-type cytochrome/quinol oxidase subunit 3
MKLGPVALLIGILALIIIGLFQIILPMLGIAMAFEGLILLITVLLIFSVIATILGIYGLKKDESKAYAKGGVIVGIIGIFFNAVYLGYLVYISSIFP